MNSALSGRPAKNAPRTLDLDHAGLGPASRTLARAFHEDPLFVWAAPEARRRARGLDRAFRTVTRYAVEKGTLLATEGVGAASVWIPPDRMPLTTAGMIRRGFLAWPFRFGFANFGRLAKAMDTMERTHARAAREPHWYLWVLGADPSHQGQGLGSTLLREGLVRVDETRTACYLETYQPRNVPLYERHGFEVAETVDAPGQPRMWGMLRPARS